MEEETISLIEGKTINNKDLKPKIKQIEKELKFILENCKIVLKQIKQLN
jgi:hypothetical protein